LTRARYEAESSGAGVARETASQSWHESGSSKSDVARDLADLARLHKNGDLSDSEFAEAKKKLLG
jgi:Short C-terminal domain